ANTASPFASAGSQRSRCASLPKRASGSPAWTSAGSSGSGATVRPTSAQKRQSSRKPMPMPPYASGTAIPSRLASASRIHSSRSKKSPAASLCLRRSSVTSFSRISRARSRSASDSSSKRKSMGSLHRVEEGQHQVVVLARRLDRALHLHADVDGVEFAALEVGHDPRALLEIDETDGNRGCVPGHRRVVQDRVGVHRTLAAGLDGLPVGALALAAHGSARVAKRPAVAALLDQQLPVAEALPPPAVVGAFGAADALGPRRRAGRGSGRGRGPCRLVLKHAEGEPAHLL